MTHFLRSTFIVSFFISGFCHFTHADESPSYVFSAVFWDKFKSESFSYAPWGNSEEENATFVDISVGSSSLSRKFVYYGKDKIRFFSKVRQREWEEESNSTFNQSTQPLIAEFILPPKTENTQEIVLVLGNKKKNGLLNIYPFSFSQTTVPFGSYQFISQSNKTIYLKFGKNTITLEPGKPHVAKVELEKDQKSISLRAMIQQGSRFQEAYNQRFRHSEKIRGIFFLRSNQEKLSIKKLIEFNRPINTATGYGASRLQDFELPARRQPQQY